MDNDKVDEPSLPSRKKRRLNPPRFESSFDEPEGPSSSKHRVSHSIHGFVSAFESPKQKSKAAAQMKYFPVSKHTPRPSTRFSFTDFSSSFAPSSNSAHEHVPQQHRAEPLTPLRLRLPLVADRRLPAFEEQDTCHAVGESGSPKSTAHRAHTPRTLRPFNDFDFASPVTRLKYTLDLDSAAHTLLRSASSQSVPGKLPLARPSTLHPFTDFTFASPVAKPNLAADPENPENPDSTTKTTAADPAQPHTPLRPLNPPDFRRSPATDRKLPTSEQQDSFARPLVGGGSTISTTQIAPTLSASRSSKPRTLRPFTEFDFASPVAKLEHAPNPEQLNDPRPHAPMRSSQPHVFTTPPKAPLTAHRPCLPPVTDKKLLPLFGARDEKSRDSHATRADILARSSCPDTPLAQRPRLSATDKKLLPHTNALAGLAQLARPRSAAQVEFARGLNLSPEKGGKDRGPKYIRGGLAERAAGLLARSKTSSSLWHTELQQQHPRYPRPDVRLRIVAIRSVTPSPGAVTTCRAVGQDAEQEGTVVFLLAGGGTEGFAEGRDVAVWWPWHEIDMPDPADPVQYPDPNKDANVKTGRTALLCSRFLVLPEASANVRS